MSCLNNRKLNLFGFFAVVAVILTGYYLQYFVGVLPCPLCMVQRFFYYLICFSFFLVFLHNPAQKGRLIYDACILLFAIIGAVAASRQVWVQVYPQEAPEFCVPGFQYMIANFPFSRMIEFLFYGSGDCSEVGWKLLGLSIAGWSLILFVLIGLFALLRIVFVAKR